jgi:hypothetical protein
MSDDAANNAATSTTAGNGSFAGLAGYRQMKTHFPSARVKKLLQSDEDVGKVAQATPLVVGRAVELFMCALVEKALMESANSHSKKIGVQTLKKVIDENEEFDFIADVCDKYSDSKDREKEKEKDNQ